MPREVACPAGGIPDSFVPLRRLGLHHSIVGPPPLLQSPRHEPRPHTPVATAMGPLRSLIKEVKNTALDAVKPKPEPPVARRAGGEHCGLRGCCFAPYHNHAHGPHQCSCAPCCASMSMQHRGCATVWYPADCGADSRRGRTGPVPRRLSQLGLERRQEAGQGRQVQGRLCHDPGRQRAAGPLPQPHAR